MAVAIVTITEEQAEEAVCGDSGLGVCIECGNTEYGCEPDARKYLCEYCGAEAVYGIAEALLLGLVGLVE